jgi:hypothetical protein
MRNATGVARKENIRKGHRTVEKEKEQWKFKENSGKNKESNKEKKKAKKRESKEKNRQQEEQREWRDREINREGERTVGKGNEEIKYVER